MFTQEGGRGGLSLARWKAFLAKMFLLQNLHAAGVGKACKRRGVLGAEAQFRCRDFRVVIPCARRFMGSLNLRVITIAE